MKYCSIKNPYSKENFIYNKFCLKLLANNIQKYSTHNKINLIIYGINCKYNKQHKIRYLVTWFINRTI